MSTRCKFCCMDKRRQGTLRVDVDELRRLARELAARRDSVYAEMQGEVELMKASLRERAAAIAERERKLAELEQRVGANGLAEELAAARRAAAEAEAEKALAAAERERLDEREQQIRTVEKELAAARRELREISLDHLWQNEEPAISRQKAQDISHQRLEAGALGEGRNGLRLLDPGQHRAANEAPQIGALIDQPAQRAEIIGDLVERLLLVGERIQRRRIARAETGGA